MDKGLWICTYFAFLNVPILPIHSLPYPSEQNPNLFTFLFLVSGIYHKVQNVYGTTEYIFWQLSKKTIKCLWSSRWLLT